MSMLNLLLYIVLFATPASDKGLEAGDRAPDFTLKKFDGEQVTLNDLKGHIVLLDFWASWCLPCREELPYLDILQKSYGKRGFTILAINIDNHSKNALEFLKQHEILLPTVWDEEKKVVTKYNLEAMPSSFLLDEGGIIRFVHSGFKSEDFDKYRSEIELLLKEKDKTSSSNSRSKQGE